MDSRERFQQPFWLRSIIDGSGLGTWLWNVQTGETVFNEQWAKIIGYTLDELEPISIETWMKFAHPDDLAQSGEKLERHFRGETEFYHCDARMKHKDGHWVWVRDHGQLVSRTETGEPEWMAGSHMDITEETELRNNLLRLNKIAKTIPGVIYEYRQTLDGFSHFPLASDGILDIYGVTAEVAMADASAVFETIHPDDLEQVSQSIQKSFDLLTEWFSEYRVIVNGKEKWVSGYAIPERNEEDNSVSWFGQIIDTTADKLIELELAESKQNLERAQRIGKLGYWRANLETGELYWSDMIYEIFGVDKATFTPSVEAFSNFVHPDDKAAVLASENRAAISGVHDVEHRIVLPEGEIRWVHELADFTQKKGQPFLIGTVRDITRQKLYEQDLQTLTLTDELTGAYNRRYFSTRLSALMNQVSARDVPVTIAVLDIDHFKHVNDTYGHDVGDVVLKSITSAAIDYLRSNDVFARLGGEEFGIIMEGCDAETATERLNALRQGIANIPLVANDREFFITVTIGVSAVEPEDSYEIALKRADQALYQGKTSGRNQVVNFTEI